MDETQEAKDRAAVEAWAAELSADEELPAKIAALIERLEPDDMPDETPALRARMEALRSQMKR